MMVSRPCFATTSTSIHETDKGWPPMADETIKLVSADARTPQLAECLVSVWKRSVRATHAFLTEAEIVLTYGIEHLGVTELTVNEQNPGAVGFYEHMGFSTYRRTDLDEEGRPYPLLYMRR